MTNYDKKLKETVSEAFRSADDAPRFERVWQAALNQRRLSQKRYRSFAAAAVLAAVAVVVLNLQVLRQDDVQYLQAAELLEATSWESPTDVLLPQRQIDVYEDLPVLIESTEPAGGALL